MFKLAKNYVSIKVWIPKLNQMHFLIYGSQRPLAKKIMTCYVSSAIDFEFFKSNYSYWSTDIDNLKVT